MKTSSYKLLRNICANQTGFLAAAAVTFFLSPFVVHSLGETRYGIWSLIVSITGNYGLLAFGIQGAMTRYIAHAAAGGDREKVCGYFNTALSFLLFSAMLAIVVGVFISAYISDIFVLPPELVPDAKNACILATVSAASTFAFVAFNCVLVAHQRFAVTNTIGTLFTLIRAALTVWLLRQGYGIVALAAMGTGITVLNCITESVVTLRLYSWLTVSLRFVQRTYFTELVSYGYKSFVVGIAVMLVYQCDLLVIGMYLPPANITTYSLAATLIAYLMQFVSSIAATFGPYTTGLYAQGNIAEMRTFFIQGSCLMYMLGGVTVAGCLVFGTDFFTLWVGPDFSGSAMILSILVIPQFFATGARIGSSLLVGMAKIGPLAVSAICEGISHLILSLILVQYAGIYGVAVGALIPLIINNGLWFPVYISRVIGIRYHYVYLHSVLPGALLGVFGYIAGFAIHELFKPVSWAVFIVDVLFVTVCCTIVAIYQNTRVTGDLSFKKIVWAGET